MEREEDGNGNALAHFLCGYIQMRFTTLCGGLCQTALWRSSQSFLM